MSEVVKNTESFILNGTTDQLTPEDLRQLFGSIDSVTSTIIVTLLGALKRQKVEPSDALIQLIPYIQTRDYLILLALTLRFGANPNDYVYIEDQKRNIHLLGYVYITLRDKVDPAVLNKIIVLLVIKGARWTMSFYDQKGGEVQSDDPLTLGKNSSISVQEWLNSNGYTTIFDKLSGNIGSTIDPVTLTEMAILLDRRTLIVGDTTNISSDFNELIIRSHANSFISDITIPDKNDAKYPIDNVLLVMAVNYLNDTAFNILMSRGQLPSYLLINRIIRCVVENSRSQNVIVRQALVNMLSNAGEKGIIFDRDQMFLVSDIGRDAYDSIVKSYSDPYWKKVCTVQNTVVSPELKQLAFSLNLDPSMSKKSLCNALESLSKISPERLREAAYRRHQLQVSSQLFGIESFVDNKIPSFTCRNKAQLNPDPLNYNDVASAFYQDSTGAVFCFTSDRFDDLISSHKNPYTLDDLSEEFMQSLRLKQELLKDIGIPSSNPMTFEQAIKQLTQPDDIKTSDTTVDRAVKFSIINGFPEDSYRNLSITDMKKALRGTQSQTGYSDTLLDGLSKSHALTTFSFIINTLAVTQPNIVKNIFTILVGPGLTKYN